LRLIASSGGGHIVSLNEKNIDDLVYNKNIKYFFCNGNESIRGGVIRSIFLSEKFKDVRFNERMCFSEDLLFHLECLNKSEKRVLLHKPFYYNVNNYDKPHAFAIKYYNRENFLGVRKILLESQSDMLIANLGIDVFEAIKFGDLIFYINSIIVNEKKYVKKIKEFLSDPFWLQAYNRKNYKLYCKHINYNSGKSYRIQAFLIAHKMYRLYSLAMKVYERKFK